MNTVGVDLRHALRTLARTPFYALVMVALLAWGIGASTATFSLIDAALLESVPFQAPDRLALVFEGIPKANLPQLPFSAPDFRDYVQAQRSFTTLAAFKNREFELSGAGDPERVVGARVSASLFATLGVVPDRGRFFAPEEDVPGQRLVVLTHGFWQRRFGGDAGILGKVLQLDRLPYTVIGVAPASFAFPPPGLRFADFVQPADLFVPMAFTPLELESRGSMFNNLVLGRLADGRTIETATAELAVMGRRIQDNYPAPLRNGAFDLVLSAVPLRRAVTGDVQRPLLVLMGAVLLVLLVACANAANLSLSRTAARQRELAVRATLGAGRWALVRLLLVESALIAVVAGVLGLLVSTWLVGVARALAPAAMRLPPRIPPGPLVLSFTLAMTLLSTVLFGLLPLLTGRRLDDQALLKEGTGRATADPSRRRLQRLLVVATSALAVVLLVGAALLARSFGRLVRTEPGFRGEGVLTATVTLPNAAYAEPERARAFARALGERLAQLPGVAAASVSTAVPLTFSERRAFVPDRPGSADTPESVTVTFVEGSYFAALGIPRLRGRDFTSGDRAGTAPAVIVSDALARRYWPGEDAVGKRLKWGVAADSDAPWMTVVGVAGDVNDGPLGSRPTPQVYVPYAQIRDGELEAAASTDSTFARVLIAAVRSRGDDPGALSREVRTVVQQLDPALPVTGVRTMDDRMASGVATQRFSTTLLAAFAGAALVLASVGLYGVLALGVAQRTREIGVRIALGATRADVVKLVVAEGLAIVGVGLVAGLLGALLLGRVLSSLLFETGVYDPVALIVAPLVLVAAAALATYLPARRAARIDPLGALRAE